MASQRTRSIIGSTLNADIHELMNLNPALDRKDALDVIQAHNYNMGCARFYVMVGRICGRFTMIPHTVAEALLRAYNDDCEEVCVAFNLLLKTIGVLEHSNHATQIAAFLIGVPHLLHRCDLLATHFRQKRWATFPGCPLVVSDGDLYKDKEVTLFDIPETSRVQVAKLQHSHARDCPLGDDCDHDRFMFHLVINSTDDQIEAEMLLLSMHYADRWSSMSYIDV